MIHPCIQIFIHLLHSCSVSFIQYIIYLMLDSSRLFNLAFTVMFQDLIKLHHNNVFFQSTLFHSSMNDSRKVRVFIHRIHSIHECCNGEIINTFPQKFYFAQAPITSMNFNFFLRNNFLDSLKSGKEQGSRFCFLSAMFCYYYVPHF